MEQTQEDGGNGDHQVERQDNEEEDTEVEWIPRMLPCYFGEELLFVGGAGTEGLENGCHPGQSEGTTDNRERDVRERMCDVCVMSFYFVIIFFN